MNALVLAVLICICIVLYAIWRTQIGKNPRRCSARDLRRSRSHCPSATNLRLMWNQFRRMTTSQIERRIRD
jgi:hypothetical protein